MKIGLVRRGYSPTGGAEAYLIRLAKGLAAQGHEPVLITSTDWPEKAWPFGTMHRLDAGTPTAFAQAVSAGNFGCDLTYALDRTPGCDAFRAGDGVHAAWLARRAKFEPPWKSWFRRFNPKHGALCILEREVFRTTKRVIANSRMVADEIVQWHDFPADNISIIPNGIGATLPLIPKSEAREKLDLPDDIFCALFVGTGWERKGLAFAVEAVDQLDGDSLLLVAGRGPAKKFRSPRAKFLGPTRDLSTLFSAADAFILPTIYDPFSNACLEGLAAGLPVITTTANGFSEIITPGVHGSVTAPGDTDGLTAALEYWSENHSEAISAECRTLAQSYSIERNVSATLEVLTSTPTDR